MIHHNVLQVCCRCVAGVLLVCCLCVACVLQCPAGHYTYDYSTYVCVMGGVRVCVSVGVRECAACTPMTTHEQVTQEVTQ